MVGRAAAALARGVIGAAILVVLVFAFGAVLGPVIVLLVAAVTP